MGLPGIQSQQTNHKVRESGLQEMLCKHNLVLELITRRSRLRHFNDTGTLSSSLVVVAREPWKSTIPAAVARNSGPMSICCPTLWHLSGSRASSQDKHWWKAFYALGTQDMNMTSTHLRPSRDFQPGKVVWHIQRPTISGGKFRQDMNKVAWESKRGLLILPEVWWIGTTSKREWFIMSVPWMNSMWWWTLDMVSVQMWPQIWKQRAE